MNNAKRLQQLDLNLLKVFQTLYQEQSMTRTAEVLHITPSAVSHAIKRLRDALGDPLFLRSKNKMLPTPTCQRMAPLIIDNQTRLQRILQQWGEFEASVSEHHFRIGMHDSLEPVIAPQLTNLFAKIAPKAGFSSIKVDRTNLVGDLAAGHIDVAIDVALPMSLALQRYELVNSEFVVLLRKQHSLLNDLNHQNYFAANHLTVSNRPTGVTAEDSLFQKKGLERHSNVRCQSYWAAKEILRTSDLLLTLPAVLARHLIDPSLAIVPTPFKLPMFASNLYWHSNSQDDPAMNWLRSLFIEQVSLLAN